MPKQSTQVSAMVRSGLRGTPATGEVETDELAVVAVDHGSQAGPAVLAAVEGGDVHGPELVGTLGPKHEPLCSWARGVLAGDG